MERLLDEAGQRAQEVERGAAQAVEETAAVAAEEGEVAVPLRAWAEPLRTWGAWQKEQQPWGPPRASWNAGWRGGSRRGGNGAGRGHCRRRSLRPRGTGWSGKERLPTLPQFGWIFGPKTLQNSQILKPAERFSDVTGLCHHSVFGAKSAENGELRKVRFLCPASKVQPGRSFSAENLLQVFTVLRNPFSTAKNLRIPAR